MGFLVFWALFVTSTLLFQTWGTILQIWEVGVIKNHFLLQIRKFLICWVSHSQLSLSLSLSHFSPKQSPSINPLHSNKFHLLDLASLTSTHAWEWQRAENLISLFSHFWFSSSKVSTWFFPPSQTLVKSCWVFEQCNCLFMLLTLMLEWG